MKWCPKQLCIITQSTAPGKLISVARKTMSSPCNVVMDLWTCIRCDMTCSREPCHLQLAPGHGQEYGLEFKNWFRLGNTLYLLNPFHLCTYINSIYLCRDVMYKILIQIDRDNSFIRKQLRIVGIMLLLYTHYSTPLSKYFLQNVLK